VLFTPAPHAFVDGMSYSIHGSNKAAHLEDLVVHKDYQRRGFGLLIHLGRDYIVRETGCYKGVLDCRNYNEKFHEKVGYTATGVDMEKWYDGAPIQDFLLQEPKAQVYDMDNKHLAS